ncbi:MAG: ABC transporter substrate-binding protein [Alkaliphilus sp.]
MKKLLVLLLSLALIFSLAACGQGEPAEVDQPATEKPAEEKPEEPVGIQTVIDAPVTVEFWHSMSGAHGEVVDAMVQAFNDQNEFITVNATFQGGYGDLSTKIMAAAKARTLPTISQAMASWMTDYVENEFSTDLTPFIHDPKFGWTEAEYKDMIEIFMENNIWDGKYYGVPFNKSTRILYYNVGLLEAAGIEPPTTWEELEVAAEKLTKDGVIGFGMENGIFRTIEQWIRQAGGRVLNEETMTAEIHSPEAVEALAFLAGMIERGHARLAGEDRFMSGPFGRGDVAMYVGSSAGIPFVRSAAEGNIEWSATVLPRGKEAAVIFAGTNITMFDSASDEEKLAAWEFLKFLLNTENTADWAVKTGYLPVRYSAFELSSYIAYVEKSPVQGVGEKQIAYGFFGYKISDAFSISSEVGKSIEKILLLQETPDEALKEAEKVLQDLIDR